MRSKTHYWGLRNINRGTIEPKRGHKPRPKPFMPFSFQTCENIFIDESGLWLCNRSDCVCLMVFITSAGFDMTVAAIAPAEEVIIRL